MNFFDPNIEIEGRLLRNIKYDNIIKDQVLIAYLSKGGISIADTDDVSPYDRKLIYDSILEIRKAETETIAIDE